MSRGPRPAQHVGSTALSMMTRAPRPVLLLEPEISVRAPSLVFFDGSQTARETLLVAAELSKACGDGLIVLTATSASQTVRQLQKEADEALTDRGVDARYRTIASVNVQPLINVAKLEGAGVLILPRTSRFIERQDFQNLIAEVRCPVFVVG